MRRRIGLIGGLVTACSKFEEELGCSVSPRTGRKEEESSLLQATIGSADRTEMERVISGPGEEIHAIEAGGGVGGATRNGTCRSEEVGKVG